MSLAKRPAGFAALQKQKEVGASCRITTVLISRRRNHRPQAAVPALDRKGWREKARKKIDSLSYIQL
jgi:hypothetical protein